MTNHDLAIFVTANLKNTRIIDYSRVRLINNFDSNEKILKQIPNNTIIVIGEIKLIKMKNLFRNSWRVFSHPTEY